MGVRFKKRFKRSYIDEDISCGYGYNFDDELNHTRMIPESGHNSVYPLYVKTIKVYIYEFLKTYLFGLYTGALKNDNINIQNYNALASTVNPIISAPDITNTDENGLSIIENQCIFANLKFDGAAYQVSVMIRVDQQGPHQIMNYYISALGVESNSIKPSELVSHLIDESIRNSYYKNKILTLKIDDEDRIDISQIPVTGFENEDLENIFIPEEVKNELIRFQQCVERFDEKGYGLRYLLCGEPGTCKTKSVRTLIKNCYNKATIIICEGNAAFKTTFSFAQLFSLVIICIDDLDLYIGTRERNIMQNSLGSLLQELDGFRKNDMFLLATANDKDLIDKAASRPGRFDLVMDFNKINKENYMNLIRTSCTSEAVLKVLDDKLLKKLEDHHVTGAYIVNLIKQLEIKYMIDPDCDLKNYIGELIKLSYRGFYKKGERNEFGFIR